MRCWLSVDHQVSNWNGFGAMVISSAWCSADQTMSKAALLGHLDHLERVARDVRACRGSASMRSRLIASWNFMLLSPCDRTLDGRYREILRECSSS
jgi:hypothetical protein